MKNMGACKVKRGYGDDTAILISTKTEQEKEKNIMKTRMVTRTFTIACVKALVVNKETALTEELTLKLPFVNETKLEKECMKALNTDKTRFVYITSFETNDEVLGMPESQFMELAIPVNRKSTKN